MSSSKRRKKSLIDEFFSGSLFDEREAFSNEAFEGGYSISVVQTPEGTKVKAKVRKDTDTNTLRRQLQKQYPDAEIEIEGGTKGSLIKEISTKSLREETKKTTE